ncbi:MAG: ECF transporter S component [Bacillota bacterium]
MLTAMALLIPLVFGTYLRIYIPPFSATLASHLPVFLAMLISPFAAVFVGTGSALGFFLVTGPVIGARAAIHILVGGTGAVLIRKGYSLKLALLLTAPLHGLGEALIVLPFGFSLADAGMVVGIGTALHHIADAFLAVAVFQLLKAASIDLQQFGITSQS